MKNVAPSDHHHLGLFYHYPYHAINNLVNDEHYTIRSNSGCLRSCKPSVVFLKGIFSEIFIISKFLKIERKLQKYLSSKLNYTHYSYIVFFQTANLDLLNLYKQKTPIL